MTEGQPDGIGYAEQEQAVRALSEHYTAGRLDVDEFDERVRRARAGVTGAELAAVFADLPEPHPAAAHRPSGTSVPEGATAQHPDGTAQDPSGTAEYPHPGTTAHPGVGGTPSPDPGPQYPGDRYPTAPYPGTPYPGAQYPGTPYPGTQYPGAQYPGAPYPGGYDQYGPQPYGDPRYGAGYGAAPYGVTPYADRYPPPGPYGMAPGSYDPAAPYGWDPITGRPYSDKQKIVAGLLQIFLPFGVGRFYTGHVGMGVAQLLVTLFTLGFGAIWPFIDGIVLLAGSPTDREGRPLRS